MTTCTSCGFDVTGKKFCPECGTPVQVAVAPTVEAATSTCPRCNGTVKVGASFCMHCGSSLVGQTQVATAQSQQQSEQSQPLTRQCIACHTEVPANTAFCTNCGQSMQTAAAQPAPTAAAPAFCNNCGRQNAPGVRFCGGCGSPLSTGTPAPAPQAYPQTGPYGQPSQPYAQYDQSQYGGQSQYQQPGTAYPQQPQVYGQQGQAYPQQYGQMGYQQQPMVGQQPMVLRCPVCMAMSPVGTANCAGCHTNLAGVVPTPANMPMQGQQGGLGGIFQGPGGGMAMGALGGAAAVIGGEMLLHGLEHEHERRYDYDRGNDGGMLGGLGGLANDIGLF